MRKLPNKVVGSRASYMSLIYLRTIRAIAVEGLGLSTHGLKKDEIFNSWFMTSELIDSVAQLRKKCEEMSK